MGEPWLSKAGVTWALWRAPDVPARLVAALVAVAAYSDENGCGAYPSAQTVAYVTRKSKRQAQYDMAELVKLGLLTLGDQRLVGHLRADRRPIVYDLPMSRGEAGCTPSGRHDTQPAAPRGGPRGAIQRRTVRNAAQNGVQPIASEEFLKNSGGRAPGAAQPPAAPPNGARKWCGRCASPTRRFKVDDDSGAVTTQPCPTCGASANKNSTEEEGAP